MDIEQVEQAAWDMVTPGWDLVQRVSEGPEARVGAIQSRSGHWCWFEYWYLVYEAVYDATDAADAVTGGMLRNSDYVCDVLSRLTSRRGES